MDRRPIGILEFPQIRERLAELTSFPPSRRMAEGLEPSDDAVIVARTLDETDQARSLLSDRPGVGIGGGPGIEPGGGGGGPRGGGAPGPVVWLAGRRAPPPR